VTTIEVLTPGLQTTVQDLGRWGHQAVGVPVAGPMDPFAHRLANALAGNHRDAAALEITLAGPVLRFDRDAVAAVAGARFDLFLDDRPVDAESSLDVHAGSVLRFGERRHGARAYLAVGGGIQVPRVLGSRATHLPTRTGGFLGRSLARGDRLECGATTRPVRRRRYAGVHHAGQEAAAHTVRVLPGPREDRFTADALDVLVSAPYHVGVDSNRMGYRLDGSPLRHRSGADIISDATPMGTIQVPASGQPLLLMADRQTTGGYATLATVITADLGLAGQAAPGDWIAFAICSQTDALSALVARERHLLAIEAAS
jgi:antagonist of KipI